MNRIYFLLFFFPLLFLTGNQQAIAQNKAIGNPKFSVEVEKKDPSNSSSKDGSITIKIDGGTAPYKIHCFSPYSEPKESSGKELNLKNIQSGDYLFVIQDKTGAIVTKEVKLGNE